MGPSNPGTTVKVGLDAADAGARIVGNHARKLDPSQGVTPLERDLGRCAAFVGGFFSGLAPSNVWNYWTK
ncbi:MAG: hypothetical protein HY720_13100 [Planctomycetes bacterium]|nr:hypothetical protein [Planctomycetota bacterium]